MFLLPVLLLVYKFYGYRKQDIRFYKVTTLLSIIIILCFVILSSLSGLFFGFSKSPFSINLVLNNIFSSFILIFCEELIRYILSNNNKFLFVFFSILFFLLDLFFLCRNISFDNYHFFLFFTTLIFPCFLFHLLCVYFSFYNCFFPGFINRLFFSIYPLVLPVYPNYGDYIYSVIFIILPFILFYFSNKHIMFYYRSKISRFNNKWLLVPIYIFLFFIFILISGISKYQFLAIGSGSMEPTISYGDAIIFEKNVDFSIGDVIVFIHDNNYVVHRVVDVNNVIYTKGDANSNVDSFKVRFDDVVGVVRFNVRFFGFPSIFINGLFD